MQSSGQTFDYTPSYAEAYKVQDRSSKQEISSLHGPVRAVVILRGSNAGSIVAVARILIFMLHDVVL
jgi:hypothetical protein